MISNVREDNARASRPIIMIFEQQFCYDYFDSIKKKIIESRIDVE